MSLRVPNFNFDMRILTINEGKGKKNRTVPLPEVFIDELQLQLTRMIRLYDEDCKTGYDGMVKRTRRVEQSDLTVKNQQQYSGRSLSISDRNLTFYPVLLVPRERKL